MRFLVAVWALIALLALMTESRARDFSLFETREVVLTYKRYVDEGRDPLIYPEDHKESLNLGLKIDVLKYGFWDSQILTQTTDAQYRSIGLDTNLGVRLTPWLDVSFHHMSQHLMDRPHSFMHKYPVEDSVNVNIYLYRNTPSRPAILE
jgi:hypothetical protein